MFINASVFVTRLINNKFFFQILLATAQLDWARGPLVWTIQFKTTLGKTLGWYGTLEFNAKAGILNDIRHHEVNVPGKKLAFISGKQGSAIDSLTFYFN